MANYIYCNLLSLLFAQVFYSLFNLFDSIDYRLLLEKRIWWLEDAKNYGNRSEKKKGFDGLLVIYYMRFTPNPFGQFGWR